MSAAVEVYYSGRVQGVGFRYTTWEIARRHPVAGFVANLPDGRVHLFAEGKRRELEQFLQDVAAAMEPYIVKQAVNWDCPPRNLATFEILR